MQSNELCYRRDAFVVDEEQHVIPSRRRCVWMPAVRSIGFYPVFADVVKEQLNYALLAIGVMSRGHRAHQDHLVDEVRIGRTDFETPTKMDLFGQRSDRGPLAFEQIRWTENVDGVVVPAA